MSRSLNVLSKILGLTASTNPNEAAAAEAKLEQQRINAKAEYAVTLVRYKKRPGCKHGDNWRVVMTIEQYARLIK